MNTVIILLIICLALITLNAYPQFYPLIGFLLVMCICSKNDRIGGGSSVPFDASGKYLQSDDLEGLKIFLDNNKIQTKHMEHMISYAMRGKKFKILKYLIDNVVIYNDLTDEHKDYIDSPEADSIREVVDSSIKIPYAYQPSTNVFIDNTKTTDFNDPVIIILKNDVTKKEEFYIDERQYFIDRLNIFKHENGGNVLLKSPNKLPSKYLYYSPTYNTHTNYKDRARDISNIFANIGESFDLIRDIFIKVDGLKSILTNKSRFIKINYSEYNVAPFVPIKTFHNKSKDHTSCVVTLGVVGVSGRLR
jgi:hypothetical protein